MMNEGDIISPESWERGIQLAIQLARWSDNGNHEITQVIAVLMRCFCWRTHEDIRRASNGEKIGDIQERLETIGKEWREKHKIMKEYPSEEQLKRIEFWDVAADLKGLLDFIKSLWQWDDYIKIADDYSEWQLRTGGWSGNEDIIAALEKNWMFWALYWSRSSRGGHYYFDTKIVAKDLKVGEDQWAKTVSENAPAIVATTLLPQDKSFFDYLRIQHGVRGAFVQCPTCEDVFLFETSNGENLKAWIRKHSRCIQIEDHGDRFVVKIYSKGGSVAGIEELREKLKSAEIVGVEVESQDG